MTNDEARPRTRASVCHSVFVILSNIWFRTSDFAGSISDSRVACYIPLMPRITDFTARGRVTAKRDDNTIVFNPVGTNYALHLQTSEPYAGPIDEPLDVLIRVNARKVYTVPSGGNFVSPIFGPPKTIQGRVRFVDGVFVVVHAGTNFIVELPAAESAIDLNSGAITVGSMLNVVAQPGATAELVAQASGTT